MRNIIIILFSTIILSFSKTKNFENENIPMFKVIIEASYYGKKDGLMERETALEKKVNKINRYNNNGELIEWEEFEVDGKLFEKSLLDLNENGIQQKGMVYDSNGNLKRYWLNDFDKKGKIIEVKTYNSIDKLLSSETNKYNVIGNIEKYLYDNLAYNYKNRTTYNYNLNNQLIEEIFYNLARNEVNKRSYKYDEKGNRIEEILENKDGKITKFICEFDKLNKLIYQKWFDKDGKQIHQTSFKYEYDNFGNWITKIRNLNGELDFVWERKIEYK